MGVASCHHRAADEYHPHQAVTRDFLGQSQAVVKNVAGEELQEDDEGEAPEDHEGEPVFRIMFNHHLGIFSDNEVDIVLYSRLLFAHKVSLKSGQTAPSKHTRHAARFARHDECCPRFALLQRLQRVVFGLGPAGTGGGIVMERDCGRPESGAVGLDHGLTELAELIRQFQFRRADFWSHCPLRSRALPGTPFLSASLILAQTWLPTMVSNDSVMWPERMMCDCTS